MDVFGDFEYSLDTTMINSRKRIYRKEVTIFKYLGNKKDVIVPESIAGVAVRKISKTFIDQDEIQTVSLPSCLEIIEAESFLRCKNLKWVKIHQTTKEVKNEAFQDCPSLEPILFYQPPKYFMNVQFHYNSFVNCPKLYDEDGFNIFYSNLIRYIGKNPHIILPNTLVHIVDYAFSNNQVIETVVIPNSVITLGSGAFSNCTNLKKATLPRFIKTIKAQTFQSCTSLEEVVLPYDVKKVEDNAFEGCFSLINIQFSNPDKEVRFDNFPYTAKIREKFLKDGIELDNRLVRGFVQKDLDDYRTDIINKLDVVSQETRELFISQWQKKIGDPYKKGNDYCYIGQNTLRNLVFYHRSTKEMGIYFNSGCHLELAELELYLEYHIKKGNTAETAVLLEYKDKNIDKDYLETDSLKNELLDFGIYAANLEELSESWTFHQESNVITITGYKGENTTEALPAQLDDGKLVKMIGKSEVGYGCLEEFFLPQGLVEIKLDAFSQTSLKEVYIPNTVKIIGSNAFAQSELVTVIFEVGYSEITLHSTVFSGCSKLKKVVFGGNISEISYGAFTSCVSLTEIFLPHGMTKLGRSVFSDCTSLKKVELPSTLSSIHTFAFKNCTALEEITIPDSMMEIKGRSFIDCTSLKKVILSKASTLEKIYHSAFRGCTALAFIGTEGGKNLLEEFKKRE